MRQTKSASIGQAEKGLLIMPQLNGKLCLPVFFCGFQPLERLWYNENESQQKGGCLWQYSKFYRTYGQWGL